MKRFVLALALLPAILNAADEGVKVSGSLRTRTEMWDWFESTANSNYAFQGTLLRLNLTQSKRLFDWQVELAAPLLLGLPSDAIAAGAQGQLGLGAAYFAANNRNSNTGMVFVKQGFIRFKDLGGIKGQSLKIGRMELIDGTEVVPKNATLAALKRDRIAHRLIGNFGFTHVGRSVDGVQYVANNSNLNFTAFGGRPTRGVFQVDGWGELNVNLFYGALTGQVAKGSGEWRLFGIGYSDYRDGVLKTDSRAATVRRGDTEHINIGTYGGHYLHAATGKQGTADLLLWGVLQSGQWGALNHRAAAFAVEAGFQPVDMPKLRPWIRGGYNFGSGDKDPNDKTHGTFFQIMPTPRIYARMPFYNAMNLGDAFGELILRPGKRWTIRADGHALRLISSTDLWYSGGGVFQPWTFGYAGRASGNQHGLATFYDLSADFNLNAHLSLGGYVGHAAGGPVVESIYPKGQHGNFGFLELTWKF